MDDVKIMIQLGFPTPKFTFEKCGMYTLDVFVIIEQEMKKINKTKENQFQMYYTNGHIIKQF